jgi:hypothetical protein
MQRIVVIIKRIAVMKRAAAMQVVTLGCIRHVRSISRVHITTEQNPGTDEILDILALRRVETITGLNPGTDDILDILAARSGTGDIQGADCKHLRCITAVDVSDLKFR